MSTSNQGMATILVLMITVVVLFITAPFVQKSVLLHQLSTGRGQMYQDLWLAKAVARFAVKQANRYWDELINKKETLALTLAPPIGSRTQANVTLQPNDKEIRMKCTAQAQEGSISISALLTRIEQRIAISEWTVGSQLKTASNSV